MLICLVSALILCKSVYCLYDTVVIVLWGWVELPCVDLCVDGELCFIADHVQVGDHVD